MCRGRQDYRVLRDLMAAGRQERSSRLLRNFRRDMSAIATISFRSTSAVWSV
jgi:hypothetical protein